MRQRAQHLILASKKSVKQIAKATGLSLSTVRRILNNQTASDASILLVLAYFAEVPTGWREILKKTKKSSLKQKAYVRCLNAVFLPRKIAKKDNSTLWLSIGIVILSLLLVLTIFWL